MNLFYDTDALEQVSLTAKAANEQIENAAQLLDSTTTHDDWNCKERDLINEYILKNKELSKQLRENAAAFYELVAQIAKDFTDQESRISNMFEHLEELLSGFFNNGQKPDGLITITSSEWAEDHIFYPGLGGKIRKGADELAENINNILGPVSPDINFDDIRDILNDNQGYIITPQWGQDNDVIIATFSNSSSVVGFDSISMDGQS